MGAPPVPVLRAVAGGDRHTTATTCNHAFAWIERKIAFVETRTQKIESVAELDQQLPGGQTHVVQGVREDRRRGIEEAHADSQTQTPGR
jgi:hypothetical protein